LTGAQTGNAGQDCSSQDVESFHEDFGPDSDKIHACLSVSSLTVSSLTVSSLTVSSPTDSRQPDSSTNYPQTNSIR